MARRLILLASILFLPEARGACIADEAGEVATKVSLLRPREREISDFLSQICRKLRLATLRK
jgi:hypothetical protein